MKKFSVLVAIALLAVSGTGFAVICAYDNVPGATLLIPYFRVARNGVTAAPLPSTGTDTLISIINVSSPGVIAHVTVWNKYSKAVLDFNIPLTGKDVAAFSMRDILNGKLNANPKTQTPGPTKDPCGLNLVTGAYAPSIGYLSSQFIRFSHPESYTAGNIDPYVSIGIYAADAFAAFRPRVWDSLDESGDIKSFTSSHTSNVLDTENPACKLGSPSLDTLGGDFSGYVTVDVVNFCTNYFPEEAKTYTLDAIATAGWAQYGYTPNVLIGDVFYVDGTANSGNISGDQAIALEWTTCLTHGVYGFGQCSGINNNGAPVRTFYGKFVETLFTPNDPERNGSGAGLIANESISRTSYMFSGDGREPLGDRYAFRYLNDSVNGLRTWILVWRSDIYNDWTLAGRTANLCDWLTGDGDTIAPGAKGYGLYDAAHALTVATYDNDESLFSQPNPGGPSGNPGETLPATYLFLESQRFDLLSTTSGGINPGGFTGGWVDMQLLSPAVADELLTWQNQGWIGVQHTGPGTLLSVGHSATNLSEEFICNPNFMGTGVIIDGRASLRPLSSKSSKKAVK